MTEKEFASPSMSIKDKLASLEPPFYRIDCPLAKRLNLPLAVYANAEVNIEKSFDISSFFF